MRKLSRYAGLAMVGILSLPVVSSQQVARLYEEAKACLIRDQNELAPDQPPDFAVIEGMIGTPQDPNVQACINVILDPDGESTDSPH